MLCFTLINTVWTYTAKLKTMPTSFVKGDIKKCKKGLNGEMRRGKNLSLKG